MYEPIKKFAGEYDSIICVAGGFSLSNIKDHDIIEKYLAIDKLNF